MPGPLFHVGAIDMCPHGGQTSSISSNTRVLVSGMPVVTMADTTLVAACVFTVPPGKPQPCVKVLWLAPATRVTVMGQPAILSTSSGICQSAEGIPNGPVAPMSSQTRVVGT